MSAYELQTVICMWDLGQLTIEQAIGQILMLIKERDERPQELEGLVYSLRREQNKTDLTGFKPVRSSDH